MATNETIDPGLWPVFQETVQENRRSAVLYVVGAVVMVVLVYLLLGLVTFMFFSWVLMAKVEVPVGIFIAIYTAVFCLAGYFRWQLRESGSLGSRDDSGSAAAGMLSLFPPSVALENATISSFFLFPVTAFDLLRAIPSGLRAFSSERAQAIAFDLLRGAREGKISLETLEHYDEREPEDLHAAVRLLGSLDFVRAHRARAGETSLRTTLTWQDFVEGRGALSAGG